MELPSHPAFVVLPGFSADALIVQEVRVTGKDSLSQAPSFHRVLRPRQELHPRSADQVSPAGGDSNLKIQAWSCPGTATECSPYSSPMFTTGLAPQGTTNFSSHCLTSPRHFLFLTASTLLSYLAITPQNRGTCVSGGSQKPGASPRCPGVSW